MKHIAACVLVCLSLNGCKFPKIGEVESVNMTFATYSVPGTRCRFDAPQGLNLSFKKPLDAQNDIFTEVRILTAVWHGFESGSQTANYVAFYHGKCSRSRLAQSTDNLRAYPDLQNKDKIIKGFETELRTLKKGRVYVFEIRSNEYLLVLVETRHPGSQHIEAGDEIFERIVNSIRLEPE